MSTGVDRAPDAVVGADELFAVMRTTRSMRRLRHDPVPDEVLMRLIEAAHWGPSARNQQGCEYIVITDRAQIARLAPLWRRAVGLYDATALPRLDEAVGPRSAAAIRALAADLEQVPAVIAICHPTSAVREPYQRGALRRTVTTLGLRRTLRLLRSMREQALLRDAASAFPAMQNLLLAARALGLGASTFMLHHLVERDVADVLGVPEGVRVMALVSVGWPVGRFGPVHRRPTADIVHHDVW